MIAIHTFSELPSTNDFLKDQYHDYQQDCAIVALKQTAGRGRFDRVWQSTADLTFSLLMHQYRTYTILAPLAVVKTLAIFGYQAQIKWPNDILYQGKKCCGILVEDMFEGNNYACSVIGIGINIEEKDTSFAYIPVNKDQLLTTFLSVWETLMNAPFSQCLASYQAYSYLVGKRIQYQKALWFVDTISEEGYLVIKNGHQVKTLRSEEITLTQIYKEA